MTTEYRRFVSQLIREKNQALEDVTEEFRRLAAVGSHKIVQRTAVDTGRAKGNWVATRNGSTDQFDPNKFDPRGGVVLQQVLEVVSGLELGDTFHLGNNTPYIELLESGSHSPQSPQGMVGVTVAELEAFKL